MGDPPIEILSAKKFGPIFDNSGVVVGGDVSGPATIIGRQTTYNINQVSRKVMAIMDNLGALILALPLDSYIAIFSATRLFSLRLKVTSWELRA